jgi:hypothetical protein
MTHSSERLIHPSLLDRGLRFVMDEGIQHGILHTERIGSQEGLERAIKLNKQGYGIIKRFIHYWKYDGPVAAGQILRVPEFRKHPSVFPIALHQFEEHERMLRAMEFFVRGHLMPIVTEDTLEIAEYRDRGLQLNDGLEEYLSLAAEALAAGGTVGIAPQGGRESYLDDTRIKPAVSTLLSFAINRGVQNIALLSMNIDFKEISHPADYGQFRESKLGEYTPIVQYGKCVILEELGYTPDMRATRKGLVQLKEINKWAFYDLAAVVNEDYLAPGFDFSKQPNLL